jgi:hypothetical protein
LLCFSFTKSGCCAADTLPTFAAAINLQFLSEEERDALQQVMDDQASTERKYDNERTLGCYWEKIKTACKNPITFVAALWGFFYFWAYYGIIYVSLALARLLLSVHRMQIV